MNPGIYIQIPFCQSKCTYCHFASGVFPQELIAPYVDAVCTEISQYRQFLTQADLALPDAAPDTIYLGGGTPSLLSADQLARILGTVRAAFPSSTAWTEVTLEADPETVTAEKAIAWRAAGINRASLGAQSFADAELRASGRRHRSAHTLAAVEMLRAAGITSLNLDLILGLAGQTEESWQASLSKLLSLRPEHASLYMLDVDDDSRLGHELLSGGTRYGAEQVPDEDSQAGWFDAACAQLAAAGYEHYEISNWSLPGHRAIHNTKYWQRAPYFGFGSGAHAFNGHERWANAHDPATYVAAITDGRMPIEQRQPLTPRMALEEEVFLGLRLLDGINLARIERDYGVNLRPRIPHLIEARAVALKGDVLRLEPARLSVSDEVIAELLL
ncbi:MAG TPA: radical SAM family heme chaperone HemW [Candidatus Acidoferrales bacterium]|nr:radical SAM family heme chaperone HemW [Candidatus Acidoferrales bacterium]